MMDENSKFILEIGDHSPISYEKLIPKAPRVFWGKNCKKIATFEGSEKIFKKNLKIQNSTVEICTRLLWECVEKL